MSGSADAQPEQMEQRMELVRRLAEDGELGGSTDAPAELVALAQLVLQLAYAARPTPDLGDDGGLVERLRKKAQDVSNIARQMAEAKSLRQGGNDEQRTDLYMWPTPEQTVEWQAADRLILYREALAEADAAILIALGGYRDDMPADAVKMLQGVASNLRAVLSRSRG